MFKLKYFIVALMLIANLMLFGCSSNESEKAVNEAEANNTAEENNGQGQEEEIKQEEDPELKNIEVTYEIQDIIDGKQKVVIRINNKSDKIFTGDLHVKGLNSQKSIVDSDMVIIEDLAVGNDTYAILWFKDENIQGIEHYWAEGYEFTEDNTGSGGVLDPDITDKVNKYVYEGFGGSGNEMFKTSWYDSILKIEVFKAADVYYAEITTNQSEEEKKLTIMNVILQFDEDGIGVEKAILLDESGNKIQEKTKNW